MTCTDTWSYTVFTVNSATGWSITIFFKKISYHLTIRIRTNTIVRSFVRSFVRSLTLSYRFNYHPITRNQPWAKSFIIPCQNSHSNLNIYFEHFFIIAITTPVPMDGTLDLPLFSLAVMQFAIFISFGFLTLKSTAATIFLLSAFCFLLSAFCFLPLLYPDNN